jgi:hypothetical protein
MWTSLSAAEKLWCSGFQEVPAAKYFMVEAFISQSLLSVGNKSTAYLLLLILTVLLS